MSTEEPASALRQLEATLREFEGRRGRLGPEELDRALNDGYAHILHLETTRSQLRRRITELAEHAHEFDAAEELRRHSLSLRSLDRDIERLRDVVAQIELLTAGVKDPRAD
jgi:hypothetical protein